MQGKIKLKEGKIISIEEKVGFVEIENEFGCYSYDSAHVYPGFVDSHGHIYGLGNLLSGIRLFEAKSPEQCIKIIIEFKPDGEWITGMGWNQELFSPAFYPTKDILDEYFPDTPVYLRRADGHCAWVNSKALAIGNIINDTVDPIGGKIIRDLSGEATGILLDEAMKLVSHHIPKSTDESKQDSIIKGCNELASKGLTEIHDMDVDPDLIPLYNKLNNEHKLPIRIQSYISAQNNEYIGKCNSPFRSAMYNVNGLKFYADGALGSHGAALLEPYKDLPDSTGLMLITEDELFEKSLKGMRAGFDIAVHAIGDAASNLVIKVFKKLRMEYRNTRILRLEHAQIIPRKDILTLKEYSLIPSIQPMHCIGDIEMAEKRLSTRTLNRSYLWRTFTEAGVDFISGSDFPIESHNPLTGLYALTKRVNRMTNEPWRKEEIVDIEYAIRSYTEFPHSAAAVQNRGKLQIGFEADLSIFSGDLTSADNFGNIEAVATFVNGKKIFEK